MYFDHSIPTKACNLLVSKICHDLVSPVGAVNNGVEFLQEMGASGLHDGLGLIEHSARQASVRLQLFRMCYGAGGADAKTTGKMVYECFQNYIEKEKVTLDWDLMNVMPDCDLPAGFLQALLNLMVFTQESLPRGGQILVTMDDTCMHITGVGEMIKPKEGSLEALENDLSLDELSPKSVHGFVTSHFVTLYGLDIAADLQDDKLALSIKIP